METIQYGLFALVALLVISSYWEQVVNSIKGFRLFSAKKKESSPIIQDEIDKIREVIESKVEPVEKDKLSEIVAQWELFALTLEKNGMGECMEDMKSLLIKITEEYRKDLNEEGVNALNSIIVKDTGPRR